ncbi:MAG: glutathione S-transferase C-terminal domain-containing protein [Pseudomonadales bacterium]
MTDLNLTVLSLRYSSWSMRPWLALTHAGARFDTTTVELPEMQRQTLGSSGGMTAVVTSLASRRDMGSVTGLFPVLKVDGRPIHESMAICEWVAETWPGAGLWPDDPLDRAQARSLCCEMLSGFSNLRADLSCHLFARVPPAPLRAEVQRDVNRVHEIWRTQLDRHGGPFLGGRFGVLDCMYYPVLTRFRTYGVALPEDLAPYAAELESSAPVRALLAVARGEPRIPIYDDYVRERGGDPDAAL